VQAAEGAGKLAGLKVDYVISSPFKRCLQTAAGVVRGLTGKLEEGHWLVDWQLAEVRALRVRWLAAKGAGGQARTDVSDRGFKGGQPA
jgi:broad specificity phosphatase PhoE